MEIAVNVEQRGGAPLLWAGAAGAMGYALAVSGGIYQAGAVWWIGAALAAAWAGLLIYWRVGWEWIVCLAGAAVQIVFARTLKLPGWMVHFALPGLWVIGAAAAAKPNLFVPVLLAGYLAVGMVMLRTTPAPLIDVYEVTKDACLTFSHGGNPYAIDFPDVYADHPDWEKSFYAPGLVYGGRTHFGYPYMPLSLMVAMAGQWIAGDYRVGSLVALAGAAALMAYARRGRSGAAAATLLLASPVGYFVVLMGWSEPTVIVCVAGVVFCALRRRRGLPWAAGLMLVSKQHMPLAAPALWLLYGRTWTWGDAARAIGIGTAVTAPLMLWDWQAFWHSAAALQFADPFRLDSLNFAAMIARAGYGKTPEGLGVAVGLAAAMVCAWRGPRTAGGFAAAVAVTYLSFFALSKQAFCNYYYFALSALCSAVAAGQ